MLPTFALTLDPLDPYRFISFSCHFMRQTFCFARIILDSNLEARATIVLQSSFSVPLTMVLPGLPREAFRAKKNAAVIALDKTLAMH